MLRYTLIGLTTILSIASNPAAAGDWYAGIAGGVSQSASDAGDLQTALENTADDVQVRNLDDSATSVELYGGYLFTPNFALEGGLLSLGEYESDIELTNADIPAAQRVLADEHPVGGTGLTLAVATTLDYKSLRIGGKLGAYLGFDSEIETSVNNQTISSDGEDVSLLIGANASYIINKNWSAGLRVNLLELNDQLVTISAALEWRR